MGLKLKLKAMLLAFMCLSSSQSLAENWNYTATENSMDDSIYHAIFMLNRDGYALGFACAASTDLKMVFLAPDKSLNGDDGPDLIRVINALGLKIKLRIDKTEPEDFTAEADVPKNDLLRATTAMPSLAVFNKMKAAKFRITAALTGPAFGKMIHLTEFKKPQNQADMKKFLAVCAPSATPQ